MGKILDNPKEFLDKLSDKEFIELLNEMQINFTKKPIGVKVNENFLLKYKMQFKYNPDKNYSDFYAVPMCIDNTVETYKFIYEEDDSEERNFYVGVEE